MVQDAGAGSRGSSPLELYTVADTRVELVRGERFVEDDRVATAAGLTSGIDLALRVVERYLGRPAAEGTAR